MTPGDVAITELEPASARSVVVIDTDPGVRWALEKGLTRSGYRVFAAVTGGEALQLAAAHQPDAVVLEMLPEAGLGEELLIRLIETPSAPRVICVSIDAAPQRVIDCIRRGATDFIPKPFSLTEIRESLARALATGQQQRVMRRPERAAPGEASRSLLIGISPGTQELRLTIQQVAKTDLNCLIRGDSGTGKDMVAREVHRLSNRSDKPFVKVNCTALPEHLLESELFGYEKGAFTGAAASKPGRFELANRGIIFLDEIGDLQPSLQAKLLQVIEHKEFTKLGGRKPIRVDVQIVAATNADLEGRTRQGLFRDDLYFRLNEVCIWVTPLRDRKEDIPLLVRHFVQKHGRFAGEDPMEITGDDLSALTAYHWPGNVRELESTIKRWLALGQKVLPTPDRGSGVGPIAPVAVPPPHEPPDVASADPYTASNGHFTPVAAGPPAEEDGEAERQQILQALTEHKWNRRRAAAELGISYQTLRRRIEKFGLNENSG